MLSETSVGKSDPQPVISHILAQSAMDVFTPNFRFKGIIVTADPLQWALLY